MDPTPGPTLPHDRPGAPRDASDADDRPALSAREREVLEAVAAGKTAREASEALGLSPKTVEHHKQRIFAKLGVQNQAHAVALTLARPRSSSAEGDLASVDLTRRERQILEAIGQGLSVKQTAHQLGVAPKTVENTQGRLFAKLDARNRAQAVDRAHHLGLLPTPHRAASGE